MRLDPITEEKLAELKRAEEQARNEQSALEAYLAKERLGGLDPAQFVNRAARRKHAAQVRRKTK